MKNIKSKLHNIQEFMQTAGKKQIGYIFKYAINSTGRRKVYTFTYKDKFKPTNEN